MSLLMTVILSVCVTNSKCMILFCNCIYCNFCTNLKSNAVNLLDLSMRKWLERWDLNPKPEASRNMKSNMFLVSENSPYLIHSYYRKCNNKINRIQRGRLSSIKKRSSQLKKIITNAHKTLKVWSLFNKNNES